METTQEPKEEFKRLTVQGVAASYALRCGVSVHREGTKIIQTHSSGARKVIALCLDDEVEVRTLDDVRTLEGILWGRALAYLVQLNALPKIETN